MPNQFFSPEGDLEYYFADEYWLVDQYVGDTLYVWGLGSNQIGDNTDITRSTPRQEFTGSTNWKQVSCGNYHSIAIKTDGTLWAWGSNSSGNVGDNTTQTRSTPRQISAGGGIGVNGWKQVSGGFVFSAAIRNDGTLWTWGLNSYGQLGTNNRVQRSLPIQEATLSTNWKQVECGTYNIAAIKTDGTLWCWGRNLGGQVGDNTNEGAVGTNSRSTPRQISAGGGIGVNGWKQVSAGYYTNSAIREDGTLWTWGRNDQGQVGDNTFQSRSTPRQEATSSTNWKQVSSGSFHTAAIKTDGTLWCWGYNSDGQVGDNTTRGGTGNPVGTNSRSTPRQEFTGSTNWKQVSSGGNHTAAVKTNGTLWVWGQNSYRQLGDNTAITRSTPRQEFTGSTNWKQVECAIQGSAAVKAGAELN